MNLTVIWYNLCIEDSQVTNYHFILSTTLASDIFWCNSTRSYFSVTKTFVISQQKNLLFSSQVSPAQSSVQLHLNVFSSTFLHSAEFLQGKLSHGRTRKMLKDFR